MNKDLYDSLLKNLTSSLDKLPDKPEETAESTLKALWFFSSGTPLSATMANERTITCIK